MTQDTVLEWFGLFALFLTSCLATLLAFLAVAAFVVWAHNRTVKSIDDEDGDQ